MNQAYFIIIAAFLSIFGTAYTYLSYRNKERLALIESGLSADTFNAFGASGKFLLIVGLLFIGFSVGIYLGFLFEKYLLLNNNPNNYRNYPQAYLTMVPLCMGVALILSFVIARRK